MALGSTLGRGIAAVLFLAGVCLGQGQLGVQPGVLAPGGQADIDYSNPSRAGESVTVVVDNGDPFNPKLDSVTIQLDENGDGSALWHVPPEWTAAGFLAPESTYVFRLVSTSPDEE